MSSKKQVFDSLFTGIEDIRDAKGNIMNTVLYSRNGNPSSVFEIENPVQQWCTDADQYYAYMNRTMSSRRSAKGTVCRSRTSFAVRHIITRLRRTWSSYHRATLSFMREDPIRRYVPLSLSRRKPNGVLLSPTIRRSGLSFLPKCRKYQISSRRRGCPIPV